MENVIAAITENINKSIENTQNDSYTYIIGNNGTGKSRILGNIAKAYEVDKFTKIKSILCVTNATYDRFTLGDKHLKMHYLGARSVGNAIFHAATDRTIAKFFIDGIRQRTYFLKRLTEATSAEFYFSYENVTGKKPLLQDFVDKRKLRNTSLSKIFNAEEINWLKTQLQGDFSFSKLTKSQAEITAKFLALNPSVKIFVSRDSVQIDFKELSSGEQNRILLAAKILSKAEDRCLILIDEPEISLHLHWQMDFHKSIKKMLVGIKNFHVVVATHSPIIVAEAAKDKDSERIIILDPSKAKKTDADDEIEFTQVSSKEIDSYDELTLDYFNTATYNTKSMDIEIAEALISVAKNSSLAEKQVIRLKKLLKKKGAEPYLKNINAAIKLVERHFVGVSK
jgi:predicted ATPase